MNKIIVSLFILGLWFGSGPCLASCGPILISYTAATKQSVLKGLKTYVLFSLSRICVYLMLGLLVFFLGRFALERLSGVFSKYMLIVAGLFVVLMGVLTALGKRLEFRAWRFWQRKLIEQDKKSIVMLGLIIGLLPCAPLLAILSYIGLIARNPFSSLFYSLAFGIGTLVSPLILLVILTGLIPKFFIDKKAIYSQYLSFICGLIIVFLGLQLIGRAF